MSSEKTTPQHSDKKARNVRREYLIIIVITVMITLGIQIFLIIPLRVGSGSMEDSLLVGDYVLINRMAYQLVQPELGDIIVFKNPFNPKSDDYIKRVIALPNQEVKIIDRTVYADNQPIIDFPHVKHTASRIQADSSSTGDNFGPVIVPVGHYFVLGDNRDNSNDSRSWGFVPAGDIKGEAVFIYWSSRSDGENRLGNFFTGIRWDRIFTVL
ncbi:MAG: signal peptidase I [Patescibacteria group bacterium]